MYQSIRSLAEDAIMFQTYSSFVLILVLAVGCSSPGGADDIGVAHFQPEPIRIKLSDLPEPFHTQSASNSPQVVPPPSRPTLELPDGFRVKLFAEVPNARWLGLTPGGDVLCAASRDNNIILLSDRDGDGVAENQQLFLDESRGANLPFGMAFADGQFYLGNTDAVLRYPYRKTSTGGSRTFELGEPSTITRLPGQGYHQHWTRNETERSLLSVDRGIDTRAPATKSSSSPSTTKAALAATTKTSCADFCSSPKCRKHGAGPWACWSRPTAVSYSPRTETDGFTAYGSPDDRSLNGRRYNVPVKGKGCRRLPFVRLRLAYSWTTPSRT